MDAMDLAGMQVRFRLLQVDRGWPTTTRRGGF